MGLGLWILHGPGSPAKPGLLLLAHARTRTLLLHGHELFCPAGSLCHRPWGMLMFVLACPSAFLPCHPVFGPQTLPSFLSNSQLQLGPPFALALDTGAECNSFPHGSLGKI